VHCADRDELVGALARSAAFPPAGPAVEMMLIGFGMLAMTSWVFSAPPGG